MWAWFIHFIGNAHVIVLALFELFVIYIGLDGISFVCLHKFNYTRIYTAFFAILVVTNPSHAESLFRSINVSLQWRHNERGGVPNHQPHDCLLNRLFRCRSKKNQISASLTFVREIHRWPVNSPHKGPVTQKKLFDDVIMYVCISLISWHWNGKYFLIPSSSCNDHLNPSSQYYNCWWAGNTRNQGIIRYVNGLILDVLEYSGPSTRWVKVSLCDNPRREPDGLVCRGSA